MSWVKVDDQLWCHPKFVGMPPEAIKLWLVALCWSSSQATDGHIPRQSLSLFGHFHHRRRAVMELVKRNLWDECESGYVIHDFLEYQPSRAQRDASREAHAKRTRRWRDRSGDSTRDTAPGPARPGPIPSPIEESARDPEPTTAYFALPSNWDPGPDILMGTAARHADHITYLERFRAHYVGSSTTRTAEQWRQSYRKWAVKDAQESKRAPSPRPAAHDPYIAPIERQRARVAMLEAEEAAEARAALKGSL
jgi:hypothetical protein